MTRQVIDALAAKRLTRKAMWRVGLLAGFLGFVAAFDRVSLAFAGPLGMNKDLGLTATTFGFAVGIFTVGYVLAEIPTSVFMARIGVRRWIMRILLIWGAIQCVIAFVPDVTTLYMLRFLLGVAEAGFTPAIFFFLSSWFIRAYRPLILTLYGAMYAMSSVVGPIIGATIVQTGNSLPFSSEFAGWRMLLFALGVLAILSTILAAKGLVANPREAKWLDAEETRQYEEMLRADAEHANVPELPISKTLKDLRIWVVGFGFFCLLYATYTIQVWTPTIVLGFQESFGTTFNIYQSALIAGIPVLVGIAVGFPIAIVSRRTGQNGWLLFGAAIVGAVGCLATTFANDPTLIVVALCLVAIPGQGSGGLIIPMVSRIFGGPGVFTAIAVVTSMGSAASFFSPIVTGALIDATGNTKAGFYVMSALLLVAALLALYIHRESKRSELGEAKLSFKASDPEPLPGRRRKDRVPSV